MDQKISVGILFGGQSAEHEISLLSAKNIINALDSKKYSATLIAVDKDGVWHLCDKSEYLVNDQNPRLVTINPTDRVLSLIPGKGEKKLLSVDQQETISDLDVIFPIIHGPLGEDGTLQGLLRLINLPFVGSDVLGSAICMDKDITKKLLKQAGLPTSNYLSVKRSDPSIPSFTEASNHLGLPLFIKPANMGSSVGISRVQNEKEFEAAIQNAFLYDQKILIEEAIIGRELEVSVLGNDNPLVSVVGEIIPTGGFYSYEAKYIHENGATLINPAKLDHSISEDVKKLARQAFQVLECSGMARCDFFLKEDGRLFINEVNTLPGFTRISMYPKLWETSGLSYSDLIDRLIQLAFERYHNEK